MKRVITYGTYDYLHYGHIKLLERAKALGDYLIVGVTSEDFDRKRGKINVQQSLTERIENIRKTGLADEIIVEEYVGQKIDDIKRYDVDIFAIGSDWEGTFDYLKEYCEVVYLPRTEGISSTQIRCQEKNILMGVISDDIDYFNKYKAEDRYVNGIEITAICTNKTIENKKSLIESGISIYKDYDDMLRNVNAVYINSSVEQHYEQIVKAINMGKHVLCESPICDDKNKCKELFELAKSKNLILMDAMRTSCSTAYSRLLLLIKGGEVGNVLSVESTITNMSVLEKTKVANSFYNWGPQALLPILDILGTNYKKYNFYSKFIDNKGNEDIFTKLDLVYEKAIASLKVAEGAKSEGELIITGTKGYIIVPAPWWKTSYFELRYEDMNKNKRYFYQLDGEGIRYQLLSFAMAIKGKKNANHIDEEVSIEMCNLINKFKNRSNMYYL